MRFLLGEVFVLVSIFYFLIVLRAVTRKTKNSIWNKDVLLSTVHLFIVLGCFVFGVAFIVDGLLSFSTGREFAVQLSGFAGFVVVAIGLMKKMRVSNPSEDHSSVGEIDAGGPSKGPADGKNGPGWSPTKKAA